MGHNYGYETLMTELPTYMKQVLHFSIKDVSNTLITITKYRIYKSLYAVTEWIFISFTLPCYVVLLDGHKPCCRLDVIKWTLHSHSRKKDHKQHRYIFTLILIFMSS